MEEFRHLFRWRHNGGTGTMGFLICGAYLLGLVAIWGGAFALRIYYIKKTDKMPPMPLL